MSFVQRLIDVTFQLAQGTFAESGTDTVTLSGLRTSAKITKAGGIAMSDMELRVYGLTLSMMNQLSTFGQRIMAVPRNTVIVSAGDADSGMTVVFAGTGVGVYADLTHQAEAALVVHAAAGLTAQIAAAPPSSYAGGTDVANVLENLAGTMGVPFNNNGVSVILNNTYLHGSARDQALQAIQAADIEWNGLEDGTLAIWPKGQSRNGVVPLVSPSTGLIGYPSFDAAGVIFRTIFNPNIGFGGQVQVESSLQRASGTWHVYRVDHDLESMLPDGQWFSTVKGNNPGADVAPTS